jgi:hypothetical protein
VPQISRLSGGVKELFRLALSTLRLIVAELSLLVQKNKGKILKSLEWSFQEIMENAFQPFVSVKKPPTMEKWNPQNLLNSVFQFKGKSYTLKALLRHDAVTGQGAYNSYNDWVKEYGLTLDYALGVQPKPGSEAERELLKKGLKTLKRGNKLFYRFLNVWLKMSAQAGLVTGLLAGMSAMAVLWSMKAVVKWVFDKFNNKVEDKLSEAGESASNLLFDPDKTASFRKMSYMGKMTLVFESAHTAVDNRSTLSSSNRRASQRRASALFFFNETMEKVEKQGEKTRKEIEQMGREIMRELQVLRSEVQALKRDLNK